MPNSSENPQLPRAVLWDMDGTIIDSEPYWVAAEIELVARFGGVWTHEDGLTLVGQGLPHAAAQLQDRGVDLDILTIIDTLTDRVVESLTESIPWRPGAAQRIHEIAAAGIPQALVTMSMGRMARLVANLIPGHPLAVVVAGDDVTHAKPDPEAYELAATLLEVPVSDCVAFEDSIAGITSASRAGAVTIGLPHLIDISSAPANAFFPSLAEVTLHDIAETFTQVKEGRK